MKTLGKIGIIFIAAFWLFVILTNAAPHIRGLHASIDETMQTYIFKPERRN